MIVTENKYSPDQKSENVLSSGVANFRLNKLPIGSKTETTESSQQCLVMSSKPSHKNNNLSKKQIFELHPKKAASLLDAGPESRKVSPAGILKPSKNFSREPSVDSVNSSLKPARRGLRQPPLPESRRHDARIHQSVTYSPVSHCVTRDNANIFEKKKLRMAKI